MEYVTLDPTLEPWPHAPATEWAAVFGETPPNLRGLELIWVEGDADFGGPARALSAAVQLDSVIFLLKVTIGWGRGEDYEPVHEPRGLMIDMSKHDDPGPALDELFILLGVSHAEAQHVSPVCRFQPHRLMRLDDRNAFEVARFESKSAANLELKRFESRKHKQHYWIEPTV